jgi:hypothetical protein
MNKSVVAELYNRAHDAHYVQRDLRLALSLYQSIVQDHPIAAENEFARAQIGNIVTSVVPKDRLIESQIDLVLISLGPTAHETPGS